MASRIKRIARGIDNITRAVENDWGAVTKAFILVVLVVTTSRYARCLR
ncbi:hypothetical protein SAMN04487948_11936 [Halogranum amylolyticum]|uniref:Uncharacterized protein n=1 Tax=Halogranum amylolyticum TaxID=660520 RepID=A0A1H8VSV0_9EURY|nr:hypothetical protein [Halogranum amylolyticum]SEP18363.1 hypothetical protein SAMN04487948_11936 [Halogranum amylolyticum]